MGLSVQPVRNPNLVSASNTPQAPLKVAPVRTPNLVPPKAVAPTPKPIQVAPPKPQPVISQPWVVHPATITNPPSLTNNRGTAQNNATMPLQGSPTGNHSIIDYMHSLTEKQWKPPMLPSSDPRAYTGTVPSEGILRRLKAEQQFRQRLPQTNFPWYEHLPLLPLPFLPSLNEQEFPTYEHLPLLPE